MKRKFRWMIRDSLKRKDGKSSLRFGIIIGYWPCLHAPYIQFGLGTKLFDLWFGLPSYRNTERKRGTNHAESISSTLMQDNEHF